MKHFPLQEQCINFQIEALVISFAILIELFFILVQIFSLFGG